MAEPTLADDLDQLARLAGIVRRRVTALSEAAGPRSGLQPHMSTIDAVARSLEIETGRIIATHDLREHQTT